MHTLLQAKLFVLAFENDSRDEAVRAVIDVGRYRDTQVYKTVLRGSCKSFEWFCKKVLSLKTKKCMRNGQVDSLLSGQGLFYLEDCLCQNKASVCMTYPKVEKAWNLIAQYPVFNTNETITIKYAKVNILDVRGGQVEKFNRLATQYFVQTSLKIYLYYHIYK